MTAKDRKDYVPPRRRFRAAVDGPMIRKWYAYMPTAELARRTGLTVKQIENYVYRHNTEPWARKLASLISQLNSVKGKKGGRPRKNIRRKKTDTFFLRRNIRYFAAETTTHVDEYPSPSPENDHSGG